MEVVAWRSVVVFIFFLQLVLAQDPYGYYNRYPRNQNDYENQPPPQQSPFIQENPSEYPIQPQDQNMFNSQHIPDLNLRLGSDPSHDDLGLELLQSPQAGYSSGYPPQPQIHDGQASGSWQNHSPYIDPYVQNVNQQSMPPVGYGGFIGHPSLNSENRGVLNRSLSSFLNMGDSNLSSGVNQDYNDNEDNANQVPDENQDYGRNLYSENILDSSQNYLPQHNVSHDMGASFYGQPSTSNYGQSSNYPQEQLDMEYQEQAGMELEEQNETQIEEQSETQIEEQPDANYKGCQLSIRNLPLDHGIPMKFSEEDRKVVYPAADGIFHLDHGENLLFSCYISTFVTWRGHNEMNAFCFDGEMYTTKKKKHGPIKLQDKDYACKLITRPYFEEVGTSETQVTSYHVYFFEEMMYAVYARGNRLLFIENTVDERVAGRENFSMEKEKHLMKRTKIATLDTLQTSYSPLLLAADLKDRLGNDAYKEISKWQKVVKGLLVPTSHYVYRAQQLGAYYTAILRPIWSNLNENWEAIERAIGQFAIQSKRTLTVFSGTSGHQEFNGSTLHLPTESGEISEYIPKIFWRYVYDRHTEECVGIIGHNATYRFPKECKPVQNIGWLSTALVDGEQHSIWTVSYACACGHNEGEYWPEELEVNIEVKGVLGQDEEMN